MGKAAWNRAQHYFFFSLSPLPSYPPNHFTSLIFSSISPLFSPSYPKHLLPSFLNSLPSTCLLFFPSFHLPFLPVFLPPYFFHSYPLSLILYLSFFPSSQHQERQEVQKPSATFNSLEGTKAETAKEGGSFPHGLLHSSSLSLAARIIRVQGREK